MLQIDLMKDRTSGVSTPFEDYLFLLQVGRKRLGCAVFLDPYDYDQCPNKMKVNPKQSLSSSLRREMKL